MAFAACFEDAASAVPVASKGERGFLRPEAVACVTAA